MLIKHLKQLEAMPREHQALIRLRNCFLRHPQLVSNINKVMFDIITLQFSFPFANAQCLQDLKDCLEHLLNIVNNDNQPQL